MDIWIDPKKHRCASKTDGSKCVGPENCENGSCPLAKEHIENKKGVDCGN